MRSAWIRNVGLPSLFLFTSGLAVRGDVITFEDPPVVLDQIPRPYHGVIFSSSPYDGIVNSSVSNLPGVAGGVVSGSNVLLTDPQEFAIRPFDWEHGALFTFTSGYFAAAQQAQLTINAEGIRPGEAKLSTSFTVFPDRPTFVSFNWDRLTEITFAGLPLGMYPNTQIVMDDLTVEPQAPEPASFVLLGLAVIVLGLCKQRSA